MATSARSLAYERAGDLIHSEKFVVGHLIGRYLLIRQNFQHLGIFRPVLVAMNSFGSYWTHPHRFYKHYQATLVYRGLGVPKSASGLPDYDQ